MNQIIEPFMTRYHVPGLSVAIAKHGTIVDIGGYGFANLEHRVPATPDTVYQTASVGKQFTAALVMMLVERGQMSLETVRPLLNHTSGISDDCLSQLNYRLDYTDDVLKDLITSAPLASTPGTRFDYANAGYMLLGFIVQDVTGKFYGDLLREWIFAPLGMTATQVITEADIVSNRAAGYRLEGTEVKNQGYVSATLNRTGDGGLYTTVADLAKWDRELASGTLLSPASKQLMWTPSALAPYGFGWEIKGRTVEHDGEWQGFSTHFRRDLDTGLSIMILSNLADAPVSELAYALGIQNTAN